jgi:hypothetical protein
LRGDELHKFDSSSTIIRIVKSRNEMSRGCSTNGREEDGIVEPSDSVKRLDFVIMSEEPLASRERLSSVE